MQSLVAFAPLNSTSTRRKMKYSEIMLTGATIRSKAIRTHAVGLVKGALLYNHGNDCFRERERTRRVDSRFWILNAINIWAKEEEELELKVSWMHSPMILIKLWTKTIAWTKASCHICAAHTVAFNWNEIPSRSHFRHRVEVERVVSSRFMFPSKNQISRRKWRILCRLMGTG